MNDLYCERVLHTVLSTCFTGQKFSFFLVGKLLSRTWWVLNPPPHPSPRPYEEVQFELELIGYGLQIVHRAANMIYIKWKGINAIYLPVA